ncbi:MAG: M28 family peptidase [Jaaginema sp. PMC 1080.18]|nr:M28 family peptidase [Jaaginema sp. PMC 1080.18]MEC4866483.1 M28 family peptidase [Jaaginema sp. PMC 1078.18]
MIYMPGESYSGALPRLTAEEALIETELMQDVRFIADEIGEHNYIFYDNLAEVERFLQESFEEIGYAVERQTYTVNDRNFSNLAVEIKGSQNPDEIVIVGAHYDSVVGSPGANDNGTGAAAVLALAKAFAGKDIKRTLRFVEFTNEEPPFFWTENMGSLVYAKGCEERQENVVAMLSLETMGYFSDEPKSQKYPLGLLDKVYPDVGNFIAFVGNLDSGSLVRKVIKNFRSHTNFPSEGVALPGKVPGVGWSDHWSFWQVGYPALMVTDTAPFRYGEYHTMQDTTDKIDGDRVARIVAGLQRTIESLVNE